MHLLTHHLFSQLPAPDEIRAWDAASSKEYGLAPSVMMENAARGALEELARRLPLSGATRLLVLMGKGNNGGDGAAMARMLHDEGCRVLVCAACDLRDLPEPAAGHVFAAQRFGVPFIQAKDKGLADLPEEWRCPDVLIDALLGSGLKGELRPRELALVRAVNSFAGRAFILSLDSPSGLCGHSGLPRPEAVRADLTVAFEAPVRGLYLGRGCEYRGELALRRVGMPLALRHDSPCWRLLDPKPHAVFRPAPERHKGQAGRVLVIGGSKGMGGAPQLAGLGALRAGCGLLHLVLPGELAGAGGGVGAGPANAAPGPEFLVHGLGRGQAFSAADAPALIELVRELEPQALVIGPGLGREEGAAAALLALLTMGGRPPTVFDADALYHLAGLLKAKPAMARHLEGDILTPHPGEAARFLDEAFFEAGGPAAQEKGESRAAALQRARPEALEALCRLSCSTVILKGPGTLIGRAGHFTALAPFAEATLGVGGSGDVLAGAVASLLAQGLPLFEAASLGVWLHGRAGAILGADAPLGHLASEIAGALPLAWRELLPCSA